MFSHQAAQFFMQQPKKDENVDDRGSNPASGSSPLFSLPPHSSAAHLFASSHHHLQNSLFTNAVTSQQQADFLSAISSGKKQAMISIS